MYTMKEFLQNIVDKNKNILCFGTGLMAREVLEYEEICARTHYLIDNDVWKQGKIMEINGKDFLVISPEQMIEFLDEKTVIILASGFFKEIKRQLQKLGITQNTEIVEYPIMRVNYLSDSEEFFEQRILKECLKEYEVVLEQYHIEGEERQRRLREKEKYIRGSKDGKRPLVLPRIMVMPTTRCNMRCKGCSSLLPYFKNPKDVSIEQILKDFELFFSGIDECMRITIGGEPFLYPHLQEIVEYLIGQKKVLGIMLITNSTIMPAPQVLELLRNPKVFVEISDYGHLEKMSHLISVLESIGVNFTVLTEQKWTDMGGIQCRNRSEEELKFQYLNCDQGKVIKGMHDGKFYTCARGARMAALGVYTSEHDYFDLKETEKGSVIREKIKALYYSEKADACNYCDLATLPTKVIEAGIQMNGGFQKSEYTIVKREEYEQLKRQAQMKETYGRS